MRSSLRSRLGWLYEDKAVVIPESSTTSLLLKRGRGKQDWCANKAWGWGQEAAGKYRRKGYNEQPVSTKNASLVKHRGQGQSPMFLFKPLPQLLHCLSCWTAPCSTPLSARPRESRCHRGVRSSLGHLPHGYEFQSERDPRGLPSLCWWVVLV